MPQVPKQGESGGGGGDGLGVIFEKRQANNYDQFENIFSRQMCFFDVLTVNKNPETGNTRPCIIDY